MKILKDPESHNTKIQVSIKNHSAYQEPGIPQTE